MNRIISIFGAVRLKFKLKKLLAALFIMSVIVVWMQAQEKPKPYLSERGVDEHLSWSLNEGELLLDDAEIVRNPETKIVIRVCTKLPLKIAIRQSHAATSRIAQYLKFAYGYNSDRVFVPFFKECPVGKDKKNSFASDSQKLIKKNFDVEIWVIPKGAELPLSDKIYRSKYIKKRQTVIQQKKS